MNKQSGQTLIETIVAIFVLTLALSGGVALAIYALSNSARSFSQIVATNLAREGIEVARAMRDSNWLASDAKGNPPWDLTACADIGGRLCYPRAYDGVAGYNNYNIRSGSYRAEFSEQDKTWALASNASANFGLYLQGNGLYNHNQNGPMLYARKIKITENTASPYTNQNSNSELIVQSIVGWVGKNCTAMTNEDPETTNCKLVLEEHMTNWKDYK
ncbi:MAG: prepilin-type N-terminal cleavage/methylation domain-containing protein [Candidatus Doudnabacteria bacterium]|nr:prepilin-type N-terminal cleavage/methylation domain-containing protein [Candidatus Doudnabacteria bacterium]